MKVVPARPVWTTKGFLDEFRRIDETMADRRFCFLLGSGASASSGIPTGSQLVRIWIEELQARYDDQDLPVERWATAENLRIPDFRFDSADEFYPQVFERRFEEDKDSGYAYLERLMENKFPAVGYFALSCILSRTRHRVVITTNFDNLVSDALLYSTDTFPLVLGHEALAGFARADLRRPLVAKLHRDLFLQPKNDISGTSELDKSWHDALTRLLATYTPIVIGYGGNDGSLMDFMLQLPASTFPGGIFWCYSKTESPPTNPKIMDLLSSQGGRFIPVDNFDTILFQISTLLNLSPTNEALFQSISRRSEKIRANLEQTLGAYSSSEDGDIPDGQVTPLQREVIKDVIRPPLHRNAMEWILAAKSETNLSHKRRIYEDALKSFGANADLHYSYAHFLGEEVARTKNSQHVALAEGHFRKSIELQPGNPNLRVGYAIFLRDQNRLSEAEEWYLKAINAGNASPTHIISFATFVREKLGEISRADSIFREAIDAYPNSGSLCYSYAAFLVSEGRDPKLAEKYYRLAIEAEPSNISYIIGAINFYRKNLNDTLTANHLFRRLLQFFPDHVPSLIQYAGFLMGLGNASEAKKQLLSAWQFIVKTPSQILAALIFHVIGCSFLEKRINKAAIGYLKYLFGKFPIKRDYGYDLFLGSMETYISRGEMALLKDIGGAIAGRVAVKELDKHQLWHTTPSHKDFAL